MTHSLGKEIRARYLTSLDFFELYLSSSYAGSILFNSLYLSQEYSLTLVTSNAFSVATSYATVAASSVTAGSTVNVQVYLKDALGNAYTVIASDSTSASVVLQPMNRCAASGT